MLNLFDFLLEAIVAVVSGGYTQAKEVRPLFAVFDVEQVVVLHAHVLDDRHVVEVVAKRGTHC